jgi:signal transduction histidine kinase
VTMRSPSTPVRTRRAFPRWSVRVRLTLLYGTLFLASGAVLLAVTDLLVRRATQIPVQTAGSVTVSALPGSLASGGANAAGTIIKQLITEMSKQKVQEQLAALSSKQQTTLLHHLLTQSALALAVMTVLSIALGWIVAGRVLRPLRTITASVRHITATNLHERLHLDEPNDELKELADTFDSLLGRLDQAFRSQRRFVANASHELRTPLARQRTVVQVALSDPHLTVESLREAHHQVLASGEQQDRLIEALLTLARGQSGTDHTETFDLAQVAREVVWSRRKEAEQKGIHLLDQLEPAPMAGDPRLTERLVANLVENAVQYNVPNGGVTVVTGTFPKGSYLAVHNTGLVVAAADVDRLLQPFQRLAPDRTEEGLGLGLSIVEAIAEAHHASVMVEPQSAGGLHVRVSFPPVE